MYIVSAHILRFRRFCWRLCTYLAWCLGKAVPQFQKQISCECMKIIHSWAQYSPTKIKAFSFPTATSYGDLHDTRGREIQPQIIYCLFWKKKSERCYLHSSMATQDSPRDDLWIPSAKKYHFAVKMYHSVLIRNSSWTTAVQRLGRMCSGKVTTATFSNT